MKPVLIFCLALIAVVLSAPAPAPLGTLVVPAVTVTGVGSTAALTASQGAALLGVAKLKAAALLALAAQN